MGTLKTKDKTRQSAKTRYAILATKNDYRPEQPDEDYYEAVSTLIRAHLPEILNQYLQR